MTLIAIFLYMMLNRRFINFLNLADYKNFSCMLVRKFIVGISSDKPESMDDVVIILRKFFKIHNFEFNVSHSNYWIVCIISGDIVGIDIEDNQDINYFNIVHEFFSVTEKEHIFSEKNHQLKCFYDIGTIKESVLKAECSALNIPLNHFSVHLTNKNEFYLNKWPKLENFYIKFLFVSLFIKHVSQT